jgi:hypothetical protein
MRTVFSLVPAAAVALLSVGQTSGLSAQADPDRPVAGGGSFPPGWRVRTDVNRRTGQPGDLASVKFTTMGPDGMHTTVGPAAIYWRDADTAAGNYHVVATLTQMQRTPHREGFGILIGGRSLGDSAQTYTYFLVSPLTGEFTIRRRTGATTAAVADWTENAAVVKADSAGKANNELSVEVRAGKARFMVNGKEVYSGDAADLDTRGVVGFRVNHNLDVHLGPLGIHKL